MTLSGTGFNASHSMQCVFDNIYFEEAIYVDDNHINCSISAHSPGTMNISLGYDWMRLSDFSNIHIQSFAFTFVPTMVIEQIHPSRGPLKGGTSITISGYNFVHQTDGILPLNLKCKFLTSALNSRKNIIFEEVIYLNTVISHNGNQLICSVTFFLLISHIPFFTSLFRISLLEILNLFEQCVV